MADPPADKSTLAVVDLPDNAAGVRPKLRDKVVGQYFALLKDTAAALSAELEVLHSATSREDYRARATVKYGELVQDVAARSKSQSAAGSAPQGDRASEVGGPTEKNPEKKLDKVPGEFKVLLLGASGVSRIRIAAPALMRSPAPCAG